MCVPGRPLAQARAVKQPCACACSRPHRHGQSDDAELTARLVAIVAARDLALKSAKGKKACPVLVKLGKVHTPPLQLTTPSTTCPNNPPMAGQNLPQW